MAHEKKPTKAELEIQEHWQGYLSALDQAIEPLTNKLRQLREKKQRVELLQSVSLGLYEEMDKLAKKAGADQVTDLALEQINDFIRDAKDLMAEDPYVQKCKEFVAAGDNPEYRDVVVVMRQLRQGLERLETSSKSFQSRCHQLLEDAKAVRVAVQLAQEGNDEISMDDLKEYEVTAKARWFVQSTEFGEPVFSFDVLERTDISKYFAAEP